MRNLFLIRGLPGCGKSTLAKQLQGIVCEADDFFMKNGEYQFDVELVPQAHQQCLTNATAALLMGPEKINVIVANTFTQRWEMEPYIKLVGNHVKITICDLYDGGCDDETLFHRNQHGVPLKSFNIMRERYEHDWKSGNPIPPWER